MFILFKKNAKPIKWFIMEHNFSYTVFTFSKIFSNEVSFCHFFGKSMFFKWNPSADGLEKTDGSIGRWHRPMHRPKHRQTDGSVVHYKIQMHFWLNCYLGESNLLASVQTLFWLITHCKTKETNKSTFNEVPTVCHNDCEHNDGNDDQDNDTKNNPNLCGCGSRFRLFILVILILVFRARILFTRLEVPRKTFLAFTSS